MYIVDLYRRVRRAHFVEGMSVREVARVFDLHRSTVNKMLEYSAPPGYRQAPPAVDHLQRHQTGRREETGGAPTPDGHKLLPQAVQASGSRVPLAVAERLRLAKRGSQDGGGLRTHRPSASYPGPGCHPPCVAHSSGPPGLSSEKLASGDYDNP